MKKLTIIAGLLLITACSTLPQNDLVLSVAVTRFIQSGDASVRASGIVEHITQLQASFADNGTIDTKRSIIRAISKRVPWATLTLDEQILAQVILQLIQDNIADTPTINIDYLNQVLTIIKTTALRFK